MAEATIRDVARLAQVSVASVSRTLNGMNNVSEETRRRVTAAAESLGYVPHAGARSLSLARTHAIGVVLPDLHGEFFSELVRGMDRAASDGGYLLLLSNMHADPGQAQAALRTMRGRVDGLIVMAPNLDEGALEKSLPRALPTILLNTRAGNGSRPAIRLDNRSGAAAVAEHLIATGRRRLVHIRGPAENVDAQERADAFREAVANHPGVTLEELEGDFSEESGAAATAQLIASRRPFDAIFAGNDNMAIAALQQVRAAGLAVPDAVAVAGFDDIPLARHLDLTTVRIGMDDVGRRAVERLLPMLSGNFGRASDELQAPALVVRGTTAR